MPFDFQFFPKSSKTYTPGLVSRICFFKQLLIFHGVYKILRFFTGFITFWKILHQKSNFNNLNRVGEWPNTGSNWAPVQVLKHWLQFHEERTLFESKEDIGLKSFNVFVRVNSLHNLIKTTNLRQTIIKLGKLFIFLRSFLRSKKLKSIKNEENITCWLLNLKLYSVKF